MLILQVPPTFSDIMANNYNSQYVSLIHTKRAKFTFREPVAWTLDGEDGGTRDEIECENILHAVQIVVNEDF